MASTISEEKVMGVDDIAFKKIQDAPEFKGGENDQVLEELAAKVDDLNSSQQGDQPKSTSKTNDETEEIDYVMKIQEQGALINSLVKQLRTMIDEYRDVCQEKDRYEELSEALLQSLELEEICKRGIACQDNEGAQTSAASTQDTEDCENDETKKSEASASASEEVQNAATTGDDREQKQDALATTTTPAPLTIENLVRINAVLLREIYDLRHKIEDIHEIIAEFFDCTDDSEYDTADEQIEEPQTEPQTEPQSEAGEQ